MAELEVRNIANDIQRIHQIHLCGEAWDKIRQGMNGALQKHEKDLEFDRDMWKKAYKNQVNSAFLYNELKLCIRENKKATRDDIIQMILQQEVDGVNADLRKIKIK